MPDPKRLKGLRREWCKNKQTNPEVSCWGSISKALLYQADALPDAKEKKTESLKHQLSEKTGFTCRRETGCLTSFTHHYALLTLSQKSLMRA